MRPLFDSLQSQYDYITNETTKDEKSIDAELNAVYEATRLEFEELLPKFPTIEVSEINYDTKLPTIEELIGTPDTTEMSAEQLNELLDMQSILQDAINDAQGNINQIVARSLKMESTLLKLNKPKILEYIYRALRVFFRLASRGARAAYCTYSHIPQLNTSLHNIYGGIDCYTYTTSLIVRIQNETVQTIKIIRKNVFDLASIYKNTAAKNSLFGKILYLILNVTKIARNILETYSVAMKAIGALEGELPGAVAKSVVCGTDFAATVPEMVDTVTTLSTCILFVDTTNDNEFLQPEGESDPNSVFCD